MSEFGFGTHESAGELTRAGQSKLAGELRKFSAWAIAVGLIAVLGACAAPTGSEPPPTGGGGGGGGLYMVVAESDPDDPDAGLYGLHLGSGTATRISADGPASGPFGPGLGPSGDNGYLFGSYGAYLNRIQTADGSVTEVGDGTFIEGLAHDPEMDVLYAAFNGYLYVLSPRTAEKETTILSPPNQRDMEGLAFDAETRTLYGLARGYVEQPQFNEQYWFQLYALDVDAAEPAFAGVGSTGRLWAGAGLAFVPGTDSGAGPGGVLYAVGAQNDPGGLYRIDPETGATTRVGSTGLSPSDGVGLAWIPVATGQTGR